LIERSFDYRRINRLVVWPLIISSRIIYLIESNGSGDIGLWTFHNYEDGLMIHADMTLDCRGQRAVESAKNSFKWIFDNSEIKKIYARISVENRAASFIAISSGMKFFYCDKHFRFYEVNHEFCS